MVDIAEETIEAAPVAAPPRSAPSGLHHTAEAARQVVARSAQGGAETEPPEAAAIEPEIAAAFARDRPAAVSLVAKPISDALGARYRDETADRRKPKRINEKKLSDVAEKLAGDLLEEQDFAAKAVRWIAINVAAWARDGAELNISGAVIGNLIAIFTEDTAQAVVEMLSPPEKPLSYLEGLICGRSVDAGGGPPELPKGVLVVLSSGHFQGLREALYKNTFTRVEGEPWPTAKLERGGTKGYAQLRPPVLDGEVLLPEKEVQAWAQTMWNQQKELSDLDADALDALCALYLGQARDSDDAAIAHVDEILSMRGLKPKRGGQGRRGGYEPEQRAEMLRALSHIQNLWINIAEVKVYETDSKGKKATKPSVKTLQSRPFIITDRMGQTRLDGYMDVESFIFRPGKAFAAFLFGGGRQTGLLFQRALEYDPYRRKWEKRLTRYISWHWRAVARRGEFVQTYRVQTLMDAVGEGLSERYPGKTRGRLEKALDILEADGVIAAWEYARWDEISTDKRNWGQDWLQTTITIEAPDSIKDYYASISSGSGAGALPTLDEPEKDLAARIRLKRKELGLSQLQAAEQIGIRQGHLSKIERGRANPSMKLLRRISGWLGG